MRIKFREGVWRGRPQPLITELPPAPGLRGGRAHSGPPKPTWDPQNPAGAPTKPRRERLSWLTAIPFYLRRPDSTTRTNYLASEVFSKLLPGTPH